MLCVAIYSVVDGGELLTVLIILNCKHLFDVIASSVIFCMCFIISAGGLVVNNLIEILAGNCLICFDNSSGVKVRLEFLHF